MVEIIWWTLLTTIYEVLAAFMLVYWVAIWIVHFIAIVHGCHKMHRRGPPQSQAAADALEKGEGVVGVTVLKPLVGYPMDPNLMTNLESYFNMEYPKFELRFCVAEEGDPCIMVVKQLMSKYPNVDSTLHVGASDVGVNPKVNNLFKGYQEARYPLLLISDASIFMKPEALTEMVSIMASNIGIVHQVPYTTDRKGWPATLEKLFFGGAHCRMYLFLNVLDMLNLKVNCVTGMSCLIRKKMLDHGGGIGAFGQYLAEDYFFARYSQANGWGLRISSFPALQNHGVYSVQALFSRAVRWTKLRVKMAPVSMFLDPLSECVLLGILSSLAATVHLQADFLAFFLFHLLAWILADWTLLNIMQNGPPPFSKFEFAITWLFREFTAFFVYLSAFQNSEIQWRTSRFIVHWGGRAERINDPSDAAAAAVACIDNNEKTKVAGLTGVSIV
uniref:ceramide glucosyltransferase n=1 Tax=Hirondellea gigas TaxID=1518452 RepID=A0A2P2I4H6_9CRUS